MRPTRPTRGFTLIELMVVTVIMGIVAGLVVWQGRSARQNADFASGAYELALRIQGLKGRALSETTDYLLVVVDAADRVACEQDRNQCAHYFVLRNPQAVFNISAFDPTAPGAAADYDEDDTLPRGAVLDVATAWVPPAPFNGAPAWNPAVMSNCAGRPCFAIRFTSRGEVQAEPPLPIVPTPPGFSFVVSPLNRPSSAAERRAFFISFPAGIVKTAAF